MNRLFAAALAALTLIALAPAAMADVSLPSVFGKDMVLQRGQPVPVWGKAEPGEKVTVAVAGQRAEATADSKGRWRATLEALKAGGPHELVVRGKNELRLSGVLVGEVWICSGQSNMQWPLNRTENSATVIAKANHATCVSSSYNSW